jgi:hypothetical protein
VESLGERGDRSAGLIHHDAFHAVHGKENRVQSDGGFFLLNHLADKVVKGAEIDSSHGNALGLQQQNLPPHFFFG